MKTNFLAGLIATIVSIVVVVGLSLFLALVLEIDASKNWFTVTAAFLTIGSWLGCYKWLKPKGPVQKDQYGFEIETEVEQIDDSAFKLAYLKTSKKAFIVGVVFMLMGIPGAICILLIAENPFSGEALGGLITLLIFGLLGLLIMKITGKKKTSILNGTDPLIHAIDNNISDYVVWYHGIITKQQGNPIKELLTYQIIIYAKEMKKAVSISAENEKAYEEMMLFLATKFPDSETGHDAETKKRMKEKYGFKGLL